MESKKNGKKDVSIKDLFHYGRDNLVVARYLFEECKIINNISTLDSAGYLAILGIEQILKGCWLWEDKKFRPIHKISKIIEKINFLNEIYHNHKELIKEIELFEKLRYPYGGVSGSSVEIGTEDWKKIADLLDLIINSMPDELSCIYESIDEQNGNNTIQKGGRVLMRKPSCEE